MKKHELEEIPGVGKSIAKDLQNIGVNKINELKGRNPEELYEQSCALAGITIDRCLLYVYRGAVYYAEGGREPEKLKWWNWKDAK